MRRPRGRVEWIVFAVCVVTAVPVSLLVVAMVVGMGGTPDPFPVTDITNRPPYATFIGREYRVVGAVSATAWNDYPDKATIRSISLEPAPGVKNRFVSYATPLKRGQRVRLERAYQQFGIGFNRYYVVSVPGAGLPDDIQVTMYVEADGVPNPRVYERVDR